MEIMAIPKKTHMVGIVGIFLIPNAPLVIDLIFVKTIRIISEKPKEMCIRDRVL